MVKVSIIVPVYNTEKYLRSCLDSLLSSTLDNLEIIAIDDCSTDNSLAILKEYASRYPNIKIVTNEKNIGTGACRNLGIKLSQGEYIGFVDSDDYVNPKMYETMYNGAVANNYPEILTTGISFVTDDSNLHRDFSFSHNPEGRLIKNNSQNTTVYDESPSVCNKLFRNDTIKNYRFLEHCLWEDTAFSYTKLIEATNILYFRNFDYFYRRNINEGRSGTNYQKNNHILDIFLVVDEIEKSAKLSGKYEEFKSQIKFIQVSNCLERVDELRNWQISLDEQSSLINQIFTLIYDKYGTLEDVDKDYLTVKVSFATIEEYTSFCEAKKSTKTL